MNDFIQQYSPITHTLFATLFTWSITAAGAALVFFVKTVNPKLMDSMLGCAARAMIFVVEELIPESQRNNKNIDMLTVATMAGFGVMMILYVALC